MGNLALCNITWHDGFQTSSALGPLWKANFLVLLPMLFLALWFSNHREAIKTQRGYRKLEQRVQNEASIRLH